MVAAMKTLWMTTLMIAGVIIGTVAPETGQGSGNFCPPGDDNAYSAYDGVCYRFVESEVDYAQATRTCAEDGSGTLALVDTQGKQDFMKDQMAQRNWDELLVGAHMTEHDWHWVVDGTFVRYQGCYADVRADVLSFDVTVDVDWTQVPDDCVERCSQKQYKYAGVKLRSDNSVVCRCGNQLPDTPLQQNCEETNQRCPNSNGQLRCGSTRNTRMYRVDSQPLSLWYGVQPNDHETYRHQRCMALHNFNSYKWGDENCNGDGGDGGDYGAICQYQREREQCDGAGMHYRAGTCFSLHRGPYTWFTARARCYRDGAELLKMASLALHDELVVMSEFANGRPSRRWWIGATRGVWSWPNGEPLIYSSWADGEPNLPKGYCAVIKKNTGIRRYDWDDIACEDKKYCVCQLKTPTTTTTAIPTTTTTTMTTTTMTTTSTTTTTPPTTTTKAPTTPTTTKAPPIITPASTTTTKETPTPATTTTTKETPTPARTTTTKETPTPARTTTTKETPTPATTTTTKETPTATPTATGNEATTTSTTTTTATTTTTEKITPTPLPRTEGDNTTALRTGVIIAIVITLVTVMFAFIKLALYFCRRSGAKHGDRERLAR